MLVECEHLLVEQQLDAPHGVLNLGGDKLALPHHDDLPAVLLQQAVVALVALLVALDLRDPELPVGLRNLAAR